MHSLESDSTALNQTLAVSFCLSVISGQTLRVCPEGKPVSTFPDHALAVSQNVLHFFERPVLVERKYPDAGVVGLVHEGMGTRVIRDSNKLQVRIRLPVQGNVKVAGENLPLRPVLNFHQMAL